MAMMPINLFRQVDERTKEPANDHPLYKLLRGKVNQFTDCFVFIELMQRHLLYRGNAYAQKIFNRRGEIIELIQIHPDRISIEVNKDNTLMYVYKQSDGTNKIFQQSEIFHIRNQSEDGIVGRSPIQAVADSVGFGLNLLDHGNAVFRNGAKPDGILKLAGVLKDKEAINRLREQWMAMHGGASNAGKVAVLEQGTEYEPIAMNMRDAEFIEARKFSVEEIARIFRVPPHMIQDLSRATFSNIEEQSINFVRYTIQPWLKRWEVAIKTQLIGDNEDVFAKFQTNSLLRGDFKTRQEGYASAIQNGYMSRDEVRYLEDLNPIPNGEGSKYLIPLNLGVVGENNNDNNQQLNSDEVKKFLETLQRYKLGLYRFVFRKLLTKESKALQRIAKKEALDHNHLIEFYDKHEKPARSMLLELGEVIDKDITGVVSRVMKKYLEDRAERFAKKTISSEYVSEIAEAIQFEADKWARVFLEELSNEQ
ncbi:phage portal protein [Candidatus Parcubacteria bacterium]|nr:MAG: phage portal protein [Candidatus Parcubacteria bacterium]